MSAIIHPDDFAARFLPELSADDYHRPSGRPRLSQSIAHAIINKSPFHAHRRLSSENTQDTTDEMDQGTVVHALLLGKGKGHVVIADKDGEPFKDVRTNAAKAARAAAHARGFVPMLAHKVKPMLDLATRLRDNLETDHGVYLTGTSELAVHWTETASNGDPVLCRGMLDHWRPDIATAYDLKIVGDASPAKVARKVLDFGYDIQAHAYTTAIERVLPELTGRVQFVILFCEASTGVITPAVLAGTMRELGAMKWRRAVNTWAQCQASGKWPGYATQPIAVHAPQWALESELTAMGDADDLTRIARSLDRDDDSIDETEGDTDE